MRNQLENFVAGEDITAPALVYFDAADGFAYLASAIMVLFISTLIA